MALTGSTGYKGYSPTLPATKRPIAAVSATRGSYRQHQHMYTVPVTQSIYQHYGLHRAFTHSTCYTGHSPAVPPTRCIDPRYPLHGAVTVPANRACTVNTSSITGYTCNLLAFTCFSKCVQFPSVPATQAYRAGGEHA